MSYKTIAETLVTRLQANWATTPIVLDNDNADDYDLSSGFIYATVNFTDSDIASINGLNSINRIMGIFELHINTPIDEGIADGLGIADTLTAAFQAREFSGVICKSAKVASPKQISYKKGEYWVTPVYIPFWSDVPTYSS